MAALDDMFGKSGAGTFMGLPACADLAAFTGGIAVIGVPACTSYASVGAYCAGGPAAIRAGGQVYATSLGHQNFDLGGPVLPDGGRAVDAGDLPQVDGRNEGNRARVTEAVGRVLDKGGVPVLIGGDDSVPLPMIEAFEMRRRDVWIMQIDAHIDWRDAVEGERLGLSSTMRRASEMRHVKGIVQVGQRGIGSARPEDAADAEAWGVTFVPAREVARAGIGRALAAIPEGVEVLVCLDVDALDPSIMPAVIGRTAGGLGYWDVVELVAGVAARARIVGVDMVEFMPERDIDGQAALVAAQLLAAILGVVARQGQAL